MLCILFNKLHRSLKTGQTPPAVQCQLYSQVESLCVIRILDEYIVARTVRWISVEEHSLLLLSFIHHHKPVIFSTISGRLKSMVMNSVADSGDSWTAPQWTVPRLTFPQLNKSPISHLPNLTLPKADISKIRQFLNSSYTKPSIYPTNEKPDQIFPQTNVI